MSKNESEIKEVTAFRFAGKMYESLAEAEHDLAICNLRDFLEAEGVGSGGEWNTGMILDNLITNFEKYISLLNKLY